MIVRILIEDESYELDPERLMLSESMAIEEEWNVRPGRFGTELASGDPSSRVVGAMVWLVKVRAIAAKEQISFREAAAQLPVATFDPNIGAIREDTAVPENPTPGVTPTPKTRTTRRTSAKRPAKTA